MIDIGEVWLVEREMNTYEQLGIPRLHCHWLGQPVVRVGTGLGGTIASDAHAALAGTRRLADLLPEYGTLFMDGLKVKATRKKHVNVLSHLQGYLKKQLDATDKAELVACLEDYRQGLVPLGVPLTLLKHHLRRHATPWVAEQIYLHPYPAELMLRNHV